MATKDKILSYLERQRSANTFKIAKDLGMDRYTLLSIINELEKEGLIEYSAGIAKFLKFSVKGKAIEKKIKIEKTPSKPKRKIKRRPRKAVKKRRTYKPKKTEKKRRPKINILANTQAEIKNIEDRLKEQNKHIENLENAIKELRKTPKKRLKRKKKKVFVLKKFKPDVIVPRKQKTRKIKKAKIKIVRPEPENLSEKIRRKLFQARTLIGKTWERRKAYRYRAR